MRDALDAERRPAKGKRSGEIARLFDSSKSVGVERLRTPRSIFLKRFLGETLQLRLRGFKRCLPLRFILKFLPYDRGQFFLIPFRQSRDRLQDFL